MVSKHISLEISWEQTILYVLMCFYILNTFCYQCILVFYLICEKTLIYFLKKIIQLCLILTCIRTLFDDSCVLPWWPLKLKHKLFVIKNNILIDNIFY